MGGIKKHGTLCVCVSLWNVGLHLIKHKGKTISSPDNDKLKEWKIVIIIVGAQVGSNGQN